MRSEKVVRVKNSDVSIVQAEEQVCWQRMNKKSDIIEQIRSYSSETKLYKMIVIIVTHSSHGI
jgi:hypothetical protein